MKNKRIEKDITYTITRGDRWVQMMDLMDRILERLQDAEVDIMKLEKELKEHKKNHTMIMED